MTSATSVDNGTNVYQTSNNVTSSPLSIDVDASDVMGDPTLRALFIALYSVIFVLGISGNSLVAFVVLRNPAMHSVTNVFITNLAVSDILMCLLAVPFTPLSGLLKSWVFGDALCHIVPMTLGVTVHVSTLTSTAIAVDRYIVIVHPFRTRMQRPVCMCLISLIWLVAVTISLPLAVYMRFSWSDEHAVYICEEEWPSNEARKSFTLSNLALQYIVPCGVISFCYTNVSAVLRARARIKIAAGRNATNRERHVLEINRKRRTNRMLIAMVVIFVVCWLPLNVMHLTLEFYVELEHWPGFLLAFFIAHVIAMSSTIYNPFLYAWMNDNFRVEFNRILPCLRLRVSRNDRARNGITMRPSHASVTGMLYSVVQDATLSPGLAVGGESVSQTRWSGAVGCLGKSRGCMGRGKSGGGDGGNTVGEMAETEMREVEDGRAMRLEEVKKEWESDLNYVGDPLT